MSSKLQSKPKESSSSESIANKNDKTIKPSTSTSRESVKTLSSSTSNDHEVTETCLAEGCNNFAVSHPEWTHGYCSFDCCYIHCKKAFDMWLTS